MPKFIIRWNCGQGDNFEVVYAADEKHALKLATQAWKTDPCLQANCGVMEYTEENLKETGLQRNLYAVPV